MAPPCSGPERVPRAAVTAEYTSEEIARIRRGEAAKSAELLGADYRCLEFGDLAIQVDNDGRRRVTECLRKARPDIVLTAPPTDYHCDHEATCRLVRDACFAAPVPLYKTQQWDPAPPTEHIPHLYYVDAIEGTGAILLDTRKTIPGLRAVEKYAARMGGAENHRMRLDDGLLIKDNHVAVAGSVREAIRRARQGVGHLVKIEVEVDTLIQLHEAMEEGVDAVLLDNMIPEQLREAVEIVAGRAITEASGRINPQTAAAIAATGVDLISIGWITHSAPVLDIGLDFESQS